MRIGGGFRKGRGRRGSRSQFCPIVVRSFISGKTVSFDWAEPYETTANLLAKMATAGDAGTSVADNQLDSRPFLLGLVDYLRTYFRDNLPA